MPRGDALRRCFISFYILRASTTTNSTNIFTMIATIATVCLAASAAANPVATQGLGESCDMVLYCKQGLQCTTGLFGTDGTCIDKDSAAINLRKLGSSFGSLPPAYLSVPNVRDCLGSRFVGTYSIVCIPKTMPAACDAVSWVFLFCIMGHCPHMAYREAGRCRCRWEPRSQGRFTLQKSPAKRGEPQSCI